MMEQVVEGIVERSVSKTLTRACLALVALGLLSFVVAMATAGPAWTWGAFLVSLVFFLGLSQGGLLFAIMLTGTQASWGRPIKRIGEVLGFFLPVLYLMLLLFLFVGLPIYPWHPHPVVPPIDLTPHSPAATVSKEIWLSPWFLIGRQAVGFALLLAFDLLYLRASLRPDIIRARAILGDDTPQWWNWIAENPAQLSDEIKSGQGTQSQ